jgi:hypothetical protein
LSNLIFVPSAAVSTASSRYARLVRRLLPVILLSGVVACLSTPMRWERPGTPDSARDESECRAQAHQQAIDELPYGDGPPLYGFTSDVSMLQWKMAIDNDRAYLEDDLVRTCMHQRGFVLVPATTKP